MSVFILIFLMKEDTPASPEPIEEVEAMCEESDVNLNLVGVAEVSYNVFYCMKFFKEYNKYVYSFMSLH